MSIVGLCRTAELGFSSPGERVLAAEGDDWKGILKGDPTKWLLEDESPVVRYWTFRDLLDVSRVEVEAARQRALESEVVGEVLRQQKPEGYWESPGNMHSPHYTSTVYQLTLLGDLGGKAKDERVARGVEAVLRTQRLDGGFPGHDPRACAYGPYDIGLIIRFMHQFGVGSDPRINRMYAWIEENQTPEGGWLGTKAHCNPIPGGCLNSAANILWGLATIGRPAGREIAERGLAFLTKAVASNPRYGRELSYPQFWNFWIDDIKLAEICLGLGVSSGDKALEQCLANIRALQGRDGRWLEGHGPYPAQHRNCQRMRKLFPRKGEPSKWVTVKAMSVLRRAYTQG